MKQKLNLKKIISNVNMPPRCQCDCRSIQRTLCRGQLMGLGFGTVDEISLEDLLKKWYEDSPRQTIHAFIYNLLSKKGIENLSKNLMSCTCCYRHQHNRPKLNFD